MYKNEFILFLIIIIQLFQFFSLCFAKQINLRKIISSNEITITIRGTGNQTILCKDKCLENFIFDQLPSQILVNGVPQEIIDKTVYNLTEVINNVTMIWDSSITNCNCMFSGLTNIISIDFSKFETSEVTNMLYMFNDCISLTSLDLTSFNVERVIDFRKMFFNCFNLEIIEQNFRAPNAFDITSMFDLCRSLKSIDLSHFEANNLEYMQYTFCNCHSLISANLSNFKSEKILHLGNSFHNCTSLKILDLTNFKTPKVIGMGNLFLGCESLEYLDLSSFVFSSVDNMGNMFSRCHSLTSIVLTNFDTRKVQYMDNMFNSCYKLNSIDLSGFSTKSVINMAYMFYNCYLLTSLDLGNFETKQVTNMSHMFGNCTNLNSLNLSSFETENVNDMSFMFYGCDSLKSIEFGNFETNLVTDMSYMFYNCSALSSLNLSSFETNSITNMAHMFYNCNSLSSLDLSNFITESVTDMSFMFYGCDSLTSLELGIFKTDSVKNMNQMFYNCNSLNSLNLKYFNTLAVNSSNSRSMFENVKNTLLYCINNNSTSKNFKTQLSNYNQTNCSVLCSINSHKYILDKNKCINSCVNDNENQYEYNDICYSTCPDGTTTNYTNDNICKYICEKYYNYEQTSCIEELPMGYYLNNSKLRTIDKCDIKCYNCSLDSMCKELCISCNISQSFYPKIDDSSNEGEFINCYNETPNGYYLDTSDLIYKPYSQNTYKLEFTETNSEITNSIEVTHENVKNSETISDLNDKNTDKVSDKDTDKFTDKVTEKESDKSSTNNVISDNIDEHNFSKKSKLKYYFYDSISNKSNYSYEINADINELKKDYINLTFIELSQESKNIIINSNNLDKTNDKIYLVIYDYPSNDPQMAINNYDYKLILENGTEIDLSKINEDFYADLSIPIKNYIKSNFKYYNVFYEQGYDIYIKNSNFYNDTCSPAYYIDNDITIEDRKKEIYPNNVTLCKANCEYKSVDIELKKINCYCNLNINKNYTQNYEDNNFIIEDDGDFFDYLLDNINYKIFKCYKLVFNIDNLITNIAFYIMIFSIFAVIIINIKFYFCDLSKIKILSVKNSVIDTFIFTSKPKEKYKLNMKSKKNLLEPSKKKSIKFKKKSVRTKTNKTDTNIKFIKNVYNFSQINISGSNILLKNDKKPTNYPKKRSITLKFKNNVINNKVKEEKEDFNELPFIMAINKDKRDIFEIFVSVIIKKITLINLFCGDEKIKILLFNENFLSLIVDFFFNAILYSDEVVSHKYHNNGKLDFIVSLVLSLLSNIISSMVCYFLNYSEIIEERLDQILQMKKAPKYPIALNKFLKNLKLKVLLYIFKEIFIILFIFYYLIIFTIVYSCSKVSLLFNFLYSLIEKIIESLIVSIIIAFTRKISLQFSNRYIYNTSKYINDKF